MSQLLELWKKLKHKLADRRFLLSLLPALLIALWYFQAGQPPDPWKHRHRTRQPSFRVSRYTCQ